jgi:integrase/recombinase XerD
MSDQKRGFRPPWQITRELFLADQEVETLLQRLLCVPPHASERQTALAARDRLLVEALLFSGLRNSELCGLRIADTVVGTRQSVFLVRGTPRQDRTVYVPQHLSALVEQFVRAERPCLVRSPGKSARGHEPLLVNDRGKPFDRTTLYRRVVAILTAAGFGARAGAQLLRHTYGYLAYKRSGGNLLFIQRQMGHAHPMVSSVYAQFVDEDYAQIANRVGQTKSDLPSAPPKRKRKSHA